MALPVLISAHPNDTFSYSLPSKGSSSPRVTFRAAYRLQPDNWTYKRQAWSLLAPGQSPMDVYGSDWLTDVRKIGAENYYPWLEL